MDLPEREPSLSEASHIEPAQRLKGIYPQRQEGLYMQRVKVRAGRLSPPQLRALAEIARGFAPDYPMHITTRQDIEFHGVRSEDLRRMEKKIAMAGLVCTGACGDSVRNITVCPGAGICPGSRDVSIAADAVEEELDGFPFIQNLPRKFKISFSGCEKACGLPYINDLGFVLCADGTYRLLGAGSLGSPPRTALELSENLLSSEILAAAAAATLIFDRLGDRKKRHKARLRHVRERLGDDAFRELFRQEFRRIKGCSNVLPPISLPERNGWAEVVRLSLPDGDVTPKQGMLLADVAEHAEGEIRLDLEHGMWLVSKKPAHLPDELQALLHRPTIISCPGASLCTNAMTDCRALAGQLREKLAAGAADEPAIKISGCFHNCSHAAVADIGLIGRVKMIDGIKTECFQLVAGGGGGKTADLAIPLLSSVPASQAPDVIERLLERYRRESNNDVSLREFINQRGPTLREHLLQHFCTGISSKNSTSAHE